MRYVIAMKDTFICCARCGELMGLTKDHYIPKCYGRSIHYNYVLVPLCSSCNTIKGNDIVSPEWYKKLDISGITKLYKYLVRVRGSITGDDKGLADKLDKVLEGYDVTC